MKISKLFHWLYATLMFLPLLVAPIFGIYSHRHTIDSYSIEVPNYVKVDFNQIFSFSNPNVDSSDVVVTGTDDNFNLINTFAYYGVNLNNLDSSNIYYIKYNYHVVSGTAMVGLFNNGTAQRWLDSQEYLTERNSTFNSIRITNSETNGEIDYINFQVFNLTQIFGFGNEPTIQQFNTLFNADYYSYTLSKLVLIQNGTQVYNDTDIGSQFIYTVYGTLDKYFNFSKVFGLNQLGQYMYLNWFYGNSYIGFTCFFLLLTYWLLISLCWLIFDLLMYVPNLVHRWLDRGAIQ